MPCSISGTGASGVTSSNTTCAVPPAVSASISAFGRPMPATTLSVTISTLRWPKAQIACPSRRLAPGPTSSIGCGIGSSPVTTPAARIAVDSPTDRTTSPTTPGISIMFAPARFPLPPTFRLPDCTKPRGRATRARHFVDQDQRMVRFGRESGGAGRRDRRRGAAIAVELKRLVPGRGWPRRRHARKGESHETSRRHQPGRRRSGFRVQRPLHGPALQRPPARHQRQ